jgi:Domain of unknown function (DUF4169)
MAEIINLRLARKAKSRGEAEKTAEQNRVIFGQTKAEKKLRAAEKARSDKALESGRIEDKITVEKPDS